MKFDLNSILTQIINGFFSGVGIIIAVVVIRKFLPGTI
jgi:hypothetical protein